jgi:hypothetical protein
MGKRREIFDALKTQLEQLTWAKGVEWEKIRILASDFAEYEVPRIQFYHVSTSYTHEQGRLLAAMLINVELVTMSTAANFADQRTLFDLQEEVEQMIGSEANLGVQGVIHVRYISDETDLHSIEPYFIASLTFEVIYHKPYTRIC